MKNSFIESANQYYSKIPYKLKVVLWVIILLIILAIVSYVVYRYIKKQKEGKAIEEAKQVANNKGNLVEGRSYDSYALNLNNAFKGVDWFSTKVTALTNFNKLNDDEFIEVNNIFNKSYATKCWTCEQGETLRTWIEWDTVNDPIKKTVLDRMSRLAIA